MNEQKCEIWSFFSTVTQCWSPFLTSPQPLSFSTIFTDSELHRFVIATGRGARMKLCFMSLGLVYLIKSTPSSLWRVIQKAWFDWQKKWKQRDCSLSLLRIGKFGEHRSQQKQCEEVSFACLLSYLSVIGIFILYSLWWHTVISHSLNFQSKIWNWQNNLVPNLNF